MHDRVELCGGKVWRVRLPRVTLPVPEGMGVLKRLMLPQGELAQFYDSAEGIRYLAWIELQPGQVRGNHYHLEKREFVYLLAGETELVVKNLQGPAEELCLAAGDLAFIETGVAHALRPVTPGSAVEFSAARFDGADIHRHPVC